MWHVDTFWYSNILHLLDKKELPEYFYSQFFQPFYELDLQEFNSSLQEYYVNLDVSTPEILILRQLGKVLYKWFMAVHVCQKQKL